MIRRSLTVLHILVAVGPWALILLIIGTILMPPSYWFEVRSVRVGDTKLGGLPAVLADRVVNRPFTATWVSAVRQANRSGEFTTVCASSGTHQYNPHETSTEKLDLDWWLDPHKCRLSPGQYVLSTIWKIDVPTPWAKIVDSTSNVFEVRKHDVSKD